MQEQNTSEIIKVFIEMLALLTVLAMFFLAFNLNKISAFKQEVNYAIERQGGINNNSLKTIKQIQKKYNNYFIVNSYSYDKNHDGVVGNGEAKVTSGDPYKTAPGIEPTQYGTKFVYNFSIKIPIPFMAVMNDKDSNVSPIPRFFESSTQGTATSKVRTDDDR